MPEEISTQQKHLPYTLVYILLMGLTMLTWGIGKMGYSGLWVAMLLLGGAMFKGFLVGDWFMGLGQVRGIWGWVVTIWLLVPGSLIALAFYLADQG